MSGSPGTGRTDYQDQLSCKTKTPLRTYLSESTFDPLKSKTPNSSIITFFWPELVYPIICFLVGAGRHLGIICCHGDGMVAPSVAHQTVLVIPKSRM